MARGISLILGIDVGKNFSNPYLSRTTSEFWRRWHISLNEWFVENLYIPLGGNKKGVIRKYVNIFIVFLISGLWHGPYWHFVVWGALNGIIVIVGQLIKPLKYAVSNRLGIDENAESTVLVKRIIVFYLITLTWVFFNSGIYESIDICKQIILFDYLSLFDPELFNIAGTTVATYISLLMALIFVKVQRKRQNELELFAVYCRQPLLIQGIISGVILVACIFGASITDANVVNPQFIYFNF